MRLAIASGTGGCGAFGFEGGARLEAAAFGSPGRGRSGGALGLGSGKSVGGTGPRRGLAAKPAVPGRGIAGLLRPGPAGNGRPAIAGRAEIFEDFLQMDENFLQHDAGAVELDFQGLPISHAAGSFGPVAPVSLGVSMHGMLPALPGDNRPRALTHREGSRNALV